MKETDGIVDYKPHQMVLYVEKADGAYGPLQTGSYMSKHYIDDFWEKRRRIETDALRQLTSGTLSPVGYYMLLLDMTPADVAHRVGISVRKVIKHRTGAGFPLISVKLVKRYADVFGISVASMFCLPAPECTAFRIMQRETDNPFVVLSAIERPDSP